MRIKKIKDYKGHLYINCIRCKKRMLQANKNAPYCSSYCKNKPQPICRSCILCGTQYYNNQPKSKYCSKKCRAKAETKLSNRNSPDGITTGTIGAVSELMACIDLMKNGYEVFRAMSPASNCDILGIKDGVVHLYEVRTGTYSKTEKGKRLTWSNRKSVGKEMIVITYEDGVVHYVAGNIISSKHTASVYVREGESLEINFNSKIE